MWFGTRVVLSDQQPELWHLKIRYRRLFCNFVLKLCKSQGDSVLVCEDTAQVNKRTLIYIIWRICLVQLHFYPNKQRCLIKCPTDLLQKIIWHLQMGKITINKIGIWCNEKQRLTFTVEGDYKEEVRIIFSFINWHKTDRCLEGGPVDFRYKQASSRSLVISSVVSLRSNLLKSSNSFPVNIKWQPIEDWWFSGLRTGYPPIL